MRSERRTTELLTYLVDMRDLCFTYSRCEFEGRDGRWWYRVIAKFGRAINFIATDCEFVANDDHFRTVNKLHTRLYDRVKR